MALAATHRSRTELQSHSWAPKSTEVRLTSESQFHRALVSSGYRPRDNYHILSNVMVPVT